MSLLSISLDELNLFQQAHNLLEKDLQKGTFGFTGEIGKANFSLANAVGTDRKDVPVVIINSQIYDKQEKPFLDLTVYYEVLIEEKGKKLSGKIIFHSK